MDEMKNKIQNVIYKTCINITFLTTFTLSGCLATSGSGPGLFESGGLLDSINGVTDYYADVIGVFEAPYLAASPERLSCANRDQRCRELNNKEIELYAQARNKTISWTNLVILFYTERIKIYPKTQNGDDIKQIYAYQRVLAEKMDRGLITESEWFYLNQRKFAEISSQQQQDAANSSILRQEQNQHLKNQPTQLNCMTTKAGLTYYTTCD